MKRTVLSPAISFAAILTLSMGHVAAPRMRLVWVNTASLAAAARREGCDVP